MVKTNYGYHILLCQDKDAGFEPTYDKVKSKIFTELQKQDGMQLAEKDIFNLKESVKTPDDIDKAAAKIKATASVSPFITLDSKFGGSDSKVVESVVFDLNKNEVSSINSGENGYYIFSVIAENPAQMNEEKFKKEAPELRNRLTSIKFNTIYKDLMASLKKEMKIEVFENNL